MQTSKQPITELLGHLLVKAELEGIPFLNLTDAKHILGGQYIGLTNLELAEHLHKNNVQGIKFLNGNLMLASIDDSIKNKVYTVEIEMVEVILENCVNNRNVLERILECAAELLDNFKYTELINNKFEEFLHESHDIIESQVAIFINLVPHLKVLVVVTLQSIEDINSILQYTEFLIHELISKNIHLKMHQPEEIAIQELDSIIFS